MCIRARPIQGRGRARRLLLEGSPIRQGQQGKGEQRDRDSHAKRALMPPQQMHQTAAIKRDGTIHIASPIRQSFSPPAVEKTLWLPRPGHVQLPSSRRGR